ncbi:MAG: nicotinate-nucleotide--dimethylbenzimidazole phosphoribosyltransferase [Huintestinicola sp.]|uniref:nicotinate-nucleotide--dimethylbenzimidazole phosphoribosyltransferase n=1 Tax=Huintestinicola sp. TaxID=2981661 RepID=UPI003F060445
MDRIKLIVPADREAEGRASEKWNSIAKPLHSLGLLEDMVIKLAGIFGSESFSIDKRCAAAMCADNGVVCEGVTQTDSSVTAIVARAMAEGSSNINLMAKAAGAEVFPVNIGINGSLDIPGLFDRKIADGTGNIANGPAMTREQAEKSVCVGIDMVRDLKDKGYNIIVTGEMGIGNTTTSSAIASVLLGLPPEETTGRGAGLDSEGIKRKIAVIGRSIEINKPDPNDPIDVLSKVGGFDIGGITGLFLGGAIYRIPIVMDGFISAVSAALAALICPVSKEYMLCSHVSKEPAGRKMLEFLGFEPPITAGLCLGEGTGGVLLLPMLDAALAVYNSAHLFDNLPMEKYKEL